jgi:heat shock protein HtpX
VAPDRGVPIAPSRSTPGSAPTKLAGVLDQSTLRRQRLRNVVQGVLLVATLVAVAGLLTWVLFGPRAILWVLGAMLLVAALRPRVPTRTLLAMYGAHELAPAMAPELFRIVVVLAERAGLAAPPTLYYLPSRVPNAFAAGPRQDPAIAISDGLLRTLPSRQVAAVLAHEVSHIRSGDTRVMGLSDSIGRFVQALAYLGVFSIVFALPMSLAGGDGRLLLVSAVLIALPSLVTLLQLALSRSREFEADLEGATLTGDPESLAAALENLERSTGRIWERMLVGRGRMPDPLLLRTHPTTAERARRLRSLVPDRPERRLGDERPAPPPDRTPPAGPPRLHFPGIRW